MQNFNRLDLLSTAVTIADPRHVSLPLIYANAAFSRISGYSYQECLGQSSAFLSGALTDKLAFADASKRMWQGLSAQLCVLKYRKNGDPFHLFLVAEHLRAFCGARYILNCYFEVPPEMAWRELSFGTYRHEPPRGHHKDVNAQTRTSILHKSKTIQMLAERALNQGHKRAS